MIDFSTPTLTKEELLHYVTEEQVFRHYFGDFQLKRTYSSPFRIDRDPSFGFYYGTFGELKCNDIVKQEKLDFIAFVAKKYGISYSEAIRKITEEVTKDIGCLIDRSSHIKCTHYTYYKTQYYRIRILESAYKIHH